MENNCNRELLDFIDASPTAWHAAENLAARLREAGYTEISERDEWSLEPGGRYFAVRNGSSLIAFRIPRKLTGGFMLMAGHVDSPGFKVKEPDTVTNAGVYAQLNVERYGSMLMTPWLDRPLSVAGRVAVRDGDRIVSRLVRLDRDLLLIPNVAVHMDRSANDGKKYDIKIDMQPLTASAEKGTELTRLIAEAAGTTRENILSSELFVYPRTPGTVWGAADEFISAPRLDDLQCVFACMQGFLKAEESGSIPVFCAFDNEEVGNGTKQGADSTFLEDLLFRVSECLGRSAGEHRRAIASSFMVSADNAHALHPNHPEYSDRNDHPLINGGIVIKYNANQRYVTDAVSAAIFREICRRAGVPTQRYTNRADLSGGWTLGHVSLTHVSVAAVDIGLAQLAMHSCYETAGAKDTAYLIDAAACFFGSSLRIRREGIEILN